MSKVYIASASMIPFGKYPDSSYVGLALPPVVQAIKMAGIDKSRIGAVYCGHTHGGPLVAQRICKEIGLGTVPMLNIDNACSSSAAALNQAVQAIENGMIEVALVIGVEKLTKFKGGPVPLPEEDIEVRGGVVMPAVYAMRAQRYLYETDASVEDFARVSVKARAFGCLNPYAQMRTAVTLPEVLQARMITDPLTLLMCCPTGDGAAAAILVSEAMLGQIQSPPVRVRASVLHSGQPEDGFRDMTWPEITASSARTAYEIAGIEPQDLDLIELHDAFSSAEVIYYEALGLAKKGEGFKLVRSGATAFGGSVVVNPSGGLMARGHPVGASGVAQICELYEQLNGLAGARQVTNARLALAHVTGGGIAKLDHAACTVHILEQTHA